MALKFIKRSHFEQIDSNAKPDFGEDECSFDGKFDLFTHYVTEVTYGMDCVFVFKKDTANRSEQTSVQGTLDIVVNAIPGFAIEGGGEVDLSDEEKNVLNTTVLRVFGDFSPITKLPSTYLEAVAFYKDDLLVMAIDKSLMTPIKAKLQKMSQVYKHHTLIKTCQKKVKV